MRGCTKKDRKPKKMGRGCNIVVKPRKKRRDPLKKFKPVIKSLKFLARV